MATTMFGIPNCDTVKKARAWLDEHGVAYRFHNYKTAGVDAVRLAAWADERGWEALLNRAGTTFRKLADADKVGIDRDRALALMAAQPSLIKRPVVDRDGMLLIGFTPDAYATAFAPARVDRARGGE